MNYYISIVKSTFLNNFVLIKYFKETNPMSLHLTDYWENIRKGDIKSFERLYKELYPGLYRLALKITGDTFKSEELVQDLFIKAWNDRKKIIIKGSVKKYFFAAIHNSSVNANIEKSALKNRVNLHSPDSVWQKIQNTFVVDDIMIKNMEAREKEEEISKMIEQLPQQCKIIFRLSREENKSNKEIAEILNISEHTVRTQLYRAIEKLVNVI